MTHEALAAALFRTWGDPKTFMGAEKEALEL